MPRLSLWLYGLLLAAPLAPVAASAGEVVAADPWIESHLAESVAFYQDLHRHPELSFHETRTAGQVAAALAQCGAQVTTGVGELGVVAVLRNGDGPTVLVRADMDALPVTEATGLPYASIATDTGGDGKTVGVMHACGHDIHMACLTATARWLADHRDRWSGTVVLIGQPAEERASGAARMLDDGLYSRFPKPDFALALHVADDLEAGTVGYRSGPAMAGSTSVEVTVRGKGGHGALPHQAVDPIVMAASMVVDFQSIVSREINPVDPAVLTVGSFHGGTKSNIIPDEVTMQLTLRAFRPEVRDQLLAGIRRRAEGVAHSHGAPAPTVELAGSIQPTVNDPSLVARVVPSLVETLGADRVVEIPPTMLAEDFSLYRRDGVPAFMFRLGTVEPARLAASRAGGDPLPTLHSALYRPDPAASLRTGIRAMTAAVVGLLPKGSPSSAPSPLIHAADAGGRSAVKKKEARTSRSPMDTGRNIPR